jgi:hypothetical protein
MRSIFPMIEHGGYLHVRSLPSDAAYGLVCDLRYSSGENNNLDDKAKVANKASRFKSGTRAEGGTRDHSYERIEGHVPPLDTMDASEPKVQRRYQPQQENLVVLVTFATSG